jgi:peptidoglycan/xylan/chitin deacetylase (PgdA/CDA1 family)
MGIGKLIITLFHAKIWVDKFSLKQKLRHLSNQKLIALLALVITILIAGLWVAFLGPQFPAAEPVANQGFKIPILVYHHIGPLPEGAGMVRQDMTVSKEDFEMQVAWLKGQGYESATLEQILKYQKGQGSLPDKPVVLTFDEGFEDTLSNAPEILKRYGFVGSFAVVTQFPGFKYEDKVYGTWKQVKQASALGMEIISQTQDYFDGTDEKIGDTIFLRNLSDARKDIKDNVGKETKILAYPYGRYGARLIEKAKAAGYEMGLTENDGFFSVHTNLFEVPRLKVSGQIGLASFRRLVTGE